MFKNVMLREIKQEIFRIQISGSSNESYIHKLYILRTLSLICPNAVPALFSAIKLRLSSF